MSTYYEVRRAEKMKKAATPPPPSSSPPPSSPSIRSSKPVPDGATSDSDEELDAAYDRDRRALFEAADEEEEDWEREYERYTKDMHREVTRDTDLVEWWCVSNKY